LFTALVLPTASSFGGLLPQDRFEPYQSSNCCQAGTPVDSVGLVRICVFCGSSPGRIPAYADAAAGLGRLFAERGIGLVYGGAAVGTMGILADATLAAGGAVYGVIPTQLVDREIAHPGLTELYEVATMHQRKARMEELSDGFVALPGGAGTLEELFEVWTWAQLGLHDKPIGLLDVEGYYSRMTPLLDHMVAEEFLRPEYRGALQIDTDPVALLEKMAAVRPPGPKWSGAAAASVSDGRRPVSSEEP
jgi:uncharacterized protein (TIGR00730 family)